MVVEGCLPSLKPGPVSKFPPFSITMCASNVSSHSGTSLFTSKMLTLAATLPLSNVK